jgi:hypothetical protein
MKEEIRNEIKKEKDFYFVSGITISYGKDYYIQLELKNERRKIKAMLGREHFEKMKKLIEAIEKIEK